MPHIGLDAGSVSVKLVLFDQDGNRTMGRYEKHRGRPIEKALEMQPDSASIRYHLGAALALAGDADRAREMLQSAVEMEGFADVDAARRELAKLEP